MGLQLILRALMIVGMGATPSSPPRLSVDKVQFPLVSDERHLNHKLPLANSMMGDVPEKQMGNRWYSTSGDTEIAKRLRVALSDLKIGTSGTSFFTNSGPNGASYTLIALTGGRISRVVLVFPSGKLHWTDAHRLLIDYSVQGVFPENGAAMDDFTGTIEREGIKYYARVIGHWTQTSPDQQRMNFGAGGGMRTETVAGTKEEGPAGIIVDVDALGWAVASFVRPTMLRDVMDKNLTVGMNENEAILAMRDFALKVATINGVGSMEWYETDYALDPKKFRFAFDTNGDVRMGISGDIKSSQRLVRSATLKDGMVDSMSDVSSLLPVQRGGGRRGGRGRRGN